MRAQIISHGGAEQMVGPGECAWCHENITKGWQHWHSYDDIGCCESEHEEFRLPRSILGVDEPCSVHGWQRCGCPDDE